MLFYLTRSLSQQKMDQDEYSSFSLLDGEDQEEDEWTDVETRVSDRERVGIVSVCVLFTILHSM